VDGAAGAVTNQGLPNPISVRPSPLRHFSAALSRWRVSLPSFSSRARIARPRLRSASSWLVVDQSATCPTALTGAVTTDLTVLTQPASAGAASATMIRTRIFFLLTGAALSHGGARLNRILRRKEAGKGACVISLKQMVKFLFTLFG
jgi:hypothetical protein